MTDAGVRWFTTWVDAGDRWVALCRSNDFSTAVEAGRRWQGGHRAAAVWVNQDATDTAPARMAAMLAPPASWAA